MGELARWKAAATAISRKMRGWGKGRRPVIYVSFDDAKAYVEYLRQKTGKPYRLLSEAEWEYAARGGTNTPFAGGETLGADASQFRCRACLLGKGKAAAPMKARRVEVGTFPANPYGLNDMEGNVFEWTEDCWNPTPCRRAGRTPRRAAAIARGAW